jgi:hypothetical protein
MAFFFVSVMEFGIVCCCQAIWFSIAENNQLDHLPTNVFHFFGMSRIYRAVTIICALGGTWKDQITDFLLSKRKQILVEKFVRQLPIKDCLLFKPILIISD